MKSAMRWIPAFILMMLIFTLSSIPGRYVLSFGLWDTLLKKGGHTLGYGILALSYVYAMKFKWKSKCYWIAYILTILFALSDEFHQSFIPGRHASLIDVFGFDAGGAFLMLGFYWCLADLKD